MDFYLLSRRLTRYPATTVLLSFATADLFGAFLLLLPWMHKVPLSIIDALFTSTSAICVTGLTVVNTAETFTRLGESVLLLLMQLGGLGVMTFSMLFALGLKRPLGVKGRLLLQESFLPYTIADVKELLITIFCFTFLAEGISFFLLFLCFLRQFPLSQALFHALFHAVSAFCNAGFSTFKDGLMPYERAYAVPLIVALTILLGNTGFPVVYELLSVLKGKRKRFSLHFRLTTMAHFLLIFLGAIGLLFFETKRLWADLPWSLKIMNAFFHSISARTAGFNTSDVAGFSEHSLYILVLLMFIGACPGSTGGGIKTTTLALLYSTAWSRLRGYQRTMIWKRTIPENVVGKAITLFLVAMITVVFFHFLLTSTEPVVPFYRARSEFLATIFETVSALGTVGLSTGLTPHLNTWGKIFIILAMFIGRVGLLSLITILGRVSRPKPYFYAKEEVMVG